MPIIGEHFPMTRAARKEKLSCIKKGNSISNAKVPSQGSKPVYRIPLQYLSYNPYNTRFLAQAKTLERKFGQELSDENPEHVVEIEKFIWNEKIDRNKNTITSLIKDGQLQPGVVTSDGVILSGNRRFRLLNEINRNRDKYITDTSDLFGLDYFEAVILDEEELSKKDVIKYESFYQFGVEEKVEYNPIQKYIAANEQKNLGFTDQEIANNFISITGGKKNEVVKWLSVYELMSEYLEYIGEEGIFTSLEGREEAFLRLHTLLKSYRGKKARDVGWAFDEHDLTDLKLVFFAYIRLMRPTHDFRVFQDIFQEERSWKDFSKKVINEVDEKTFELDDFDEYRNKNPHNEESVISKIRQNDFKEIAEPNLNRLYGVEFARVSSKKASEKPIEILESIKERLLKLEEAINNNPNNDTLYEDDFVDTVREIQKRIGKIKQIVD